MFRHIMGLAVTFFVAAPVLADELDKDFSSKGTSTPVAAKKIQPVDAVAQALTPGKGSELDGEDPAQAWRRWRGYYGWRWGGYYRGWRGFYGGWGYAPLAYSYYAPFRYHYYRPYYSYAYFPRHYYGYGYYPSYSYGYYPSYSYGWWGGPGWGHCW